jgi:hypothetical protein
MPCSRARLNTLRKTLRSAGKQYLRGLKYLRENRRLVYVPQGRLKIAQHVSARCMWPARPVPQGRLRITQDVVLGWAAQIAIVHFRGRDTPRIASWVFSAVPAGLIFLSNLSPGLPRDFLYAALDKSAYAVPASRDPRGSLTPPSYTGNPGPSWATLSRPSGTQLTRVVLTQTPKPSSAPILTARLKVSLSRSSRHYAFRRRKNLHRGRQQPTD